MSDSFDLTDILDREEIEFYFKRTLSDVEWEMVCYNLRSKFWSKVRAEMRDALDDSPEFFLQKR